MSPQFLISQIIEGKMPAKKAADMINQMLMAREGMKITKSVARERANNIAASLIGVTVD